MAVIFVQKFIDATNNIFSDNTADCQLHNTENKLLYICHARHLLCEKIFPQHRNARMSMLIGYCYPSATNRLTRLIMFSQNEGFACAFLFYKNSHILSI